MEWRNYIDQNPGTLGGKPVLTGTRIAVDLILEKIGGGETIEELLFAYPHLTKEAILACITFGASVKADRLLLRLSASQHSGNIGRIITQAKN